MGYIGVRIIAPKENHPTPRIIDSLDNCPLYDCSPDYWPRTMDPLPPRTITSEENCPRKIAPGLLPPPAISSEDKCCRVKLPLGNCALDDCARKITPKIIVPWQYPPRNCPRGKLSFKWFAAYIIPPRKTDPRNIIPRMNYTQYIFPQESEIVVL